MLLNSLSKAATVAMLCFVVSSMLAMGAGLSLELWSRCAMSD